MPSDTNERNRAGGAERGWRSGRRLLRFITLLVLVYFSARIAYYVDQCVLNYNTYSCRVKAWKHKQAGELEAAEKYIDYACELDSFVAAYDMRGIIKGQLGKHKEAIRSFRIARARYDSYGECSTLAIARMLQSRGHHGEAAFEYARYVKHSYYQHIPPEHPAWVREDLRGAIRYMDSLLELELEDYPPSEMEHWLLEDRLFLEAYSILYGERLPVSPTQLEKHEEEGKPGE